MNDLISRQAIKELAHNQVREKYCGVALKEHRDFYIKLADSIIDLLPSAQPEITHEQAVEYLQSTGWMQEHDRQMMLDGVHRLTAQPEIIRKTCLQNMDDMIPKNLTKQSSASHGCHYQSHTGKKGQKNE